EQGKAMTDTMKRVMSIVYDVIDELNEQFAEENRLEKAPQSALLSNAGLLDSVAFVNLLVLVEEKCQNEFGAPILLTDDLGTEDDNSLKTVGSFIDYICRVVEKELPTLKATGQI